MKNVVMPFCLECISLQITSFLYKAGAFKGSGLFFYGFVLPAQNVKDRGKYEFGRKL